LDYYRGKVYLKAAADFLTTEEKVKLLKTNGGTLQELGQVEHTFHIGHYEAGVFDARNYTNGMCQ
jgi:hypothetical protein